MYGGLFLSPDLHYVGPYLSAQVIILEPIYCSVSSVESTYSCDQDIQGN